jgi:hypothetical protein
MYIFLSSLVPSHFTQEMINQNQRDYFLSFKSWQEQMDFDENYLFLDNTLNNVSEIVQKELLDICWQVYDFGAVRPFIRLARSGFSEDPDLGSINLLRALAADRYYKSHAYSVIILGKRRCNPTLKTSIMNWLEKDASNGLYFKDVGNNVIDNVVVIRGEILENIVEFIANQNSTVYSSLIDSIAKNFNLNLEVLDV